MATMVELGHGRTAVHHYPRSCMQMGHARDVPSRQRRDLRVWGENVRMGGDALRIPTGLTIRRAWNVPLTSGDVSYGCDGTFAWVAMV